jgi:thiosulfate/3-mercaptopyruvate sulfurtransferase
MANAMLRTMNHLPSALVSASWLATHLDDDDIAIVDCRWYIDGRSGDAAFDAGHIPGAVWVDLDRDLAGSPDVGPGRHPLPSPEHFAAAMGNLGISDDTIVVAYDDSNGSIAARLWWMLTVTGHRCAVLDGGISAWMGTLSNDLSSEITPAHFTPVPWPMGSVVDVVGVDTLRRSSGAVILDARSADRFEGWDNPIDTRFGHIPGAVSAPWTGNVDPTTGLMKTPAELRDRFRSLGATPTTSIVCHCGSGVTACHNLLALEIAGFRSARLYPGSMSDWEADPDRPVITNL